MAMNATWRRLIHGALAGGIGAASMTVLRMLAHRRGYIDQMVPQAVEAWAKRQLPVSLPSGPNQRALHHVADQLLHLGYGATFGALYATTGTRRLSAANVALWGLGLWGFGSFALLPALRIARPEWRAKPAEVAVNLTAHLAYAAALALLTDEFEKQSFIQPLQYPLSLAARTG